MVQLADQVAKGAGARNHGEPRLVQLLRGGLLLIRHRPAGAIGAELPHEGGVDRVGTDRFGRLHLNHHVVARGPLRLRARFGEPIGLGLEPPHLAQSQRQLPL